MLSWLILVCIILFLYKHTWIPASVLIYAELFLCITYKHIYTIVFIFFKCINFLHLILPSFFSHTYFLICRYFYLHKIFLIFFMFSTLPYIAKRAPGQFSICYLILSSVSPFTIIQCKNSLRVNFNEKPLNVICYKGV